MKDCTFVGLGDDALNIHGLAARIESIRSYEDGFAVIADHTGLVHIDNCVDVTVK